MRYQWANVECGWRHKTDVCRMIASRDKCQTCIGETQQGPSVVLEINAAAKSASVPLHCIGDVFYDARNVVQGIQLMRVCCHARLPEKDSGGTERCRAGHCCDRGRRFSRREAFLELESHGTSTFDGAFRDSVPTNTSLLNPVFSSMG